MYGGVVGLAEQGGGGAHHGPGRERGGDESPDWSLHYLDVAAPYSPLVSTTHPVSVGGERGHTYLEYRQQIVMVATKAATPMKTAMMRIRIWIQSTLGAVLT